MAGIQTIRFRQPINKEDGPAPAAANPPKLKHTGILQDQLRRTARPPWTPSFSVAVRILLLVRVSAAMYANIQDCDEVFNFWEPLHYLDKGYGFQVWELSPLYAIRSWAYTMLFFVPARLLSTVIHEDGKRVAFFTVRAFLAIVSSVCEAKLYDTVKERINRRVARYMLFMLATSAGMWNASTALLPSSFAMYTTALAYAYAFVPASNANTRRTLIATLTFATGAIVGWPFSLALAIPFVVEELFVFSGDRVTSGVKGSWLVDRWTRLLLCAAAAAQIAVPVILVDSFFYGKVVLVPWNIIKYNIFPDGSRGPDLYGTSPWNFYLLNLLLNFNILLPLALFALPALFVTYSIDRRRLELVKPSSSETSPFTLLTFRLLPFYLWFGIMTAQSHKEERFMFPSYPLLCFNAAVTVYLLRGWMEVVFIKITSSPYRASRSSIFRLVTLSIVLSSAFISCARIVALWKYYHAPMTIAFRFEAEELPQLLNVTGLLPTLLPSPEQRRANKKNRDLDEVSIDLSPIKQFGLRLCLGKEWHRFPSHYLIPTGVRVDWIKSAFDGQLPAHFLETHGSLQSRLEGTTRIPAGLNDLNREESMHYVDVSVCDYLIDLDFPHDPIVTAHEPRYAVSQEWERVACQPFLDARYSPLLTRTLWLPGEKWQASNKFGDYCLLRHKQNVAAKIQYIKDTTADASKEK